jgi:hypothetical protein
VKISNRPGSPKACSSISAKARCERLKFAPANGVAFYEASGWKPRDILSMYRAALRFNRVPFFMKLFRFFPEPDPRKLGKQPWGAIVRLIKD